MSKLLTGSIQQLQLPHCPQPARAKYTLTPTTPNNANAFTTFIAAFVFIFATCACQNFVSLILGKRPIRHSTSKKFTQRAPALLNIELQQPLLRHQALDLRVML